MTKEDRERLKDLGTTDEERLACALDEMEARAERAEASAEVMREAIKKELFRTGYGPPWASRLLADPDAGAGLLARHAEEVARLIRENAEHAIERDEALAEVARLTEDNMSLYAERDRHFNERDAALSEVARLTKERDELRARLTEEGRNVLRAKVNFTEREATALRARVERLTAALDQSVSMLREIYHADLARIIEDLVHAALADTT